MIYQLFAILIGQCSGIALSACHVRRTCISACKDDAGETTLILRVRLRNRILVEAKLAALKNSGNQKHSSRQIISSCVRT